jgi:signal transduction histidine kinase
MSVVGEPRPLPVEVDLAAYRILQESLTNALKHAPAGPVLALVGYRPDRVTVTVENPLPAGGDEAGLPGAGAGLVGMRERAALLRGTLAAGSADGVWRVHAELPLAPTERAGPTEQARSTERAGPAEPGTAPVRRPTEGDR